MKKFLALLIAALLIFCMVSCADKEEPEEAVENEETEANDDVYTDATGTFEFELNDSGDMEIVKYTPAGIDYVDIKLPATAEKRDVVGVAADVFKGQNYIKSITVPASYEYIGEAAFFGCEYLQSVKIEGTALKEIGRNAFAGCTSLASVSGVSAVEAIGDYAFMNCKALTSIDLSKGIASIGQGAFAGCAELTSVTLADTLKVIGKGAFQDCGKLTYTTELGCKYLGTASNKYFAVVRVENYSVTECTVNDSAKVVALDAFANCSLLEKVVLGDGIEVINGSCIADSVTLKLNEYKENALYLGTDENPYMVLFKFKVNTAEDFSIHADTKIIVDTAFENCMNLETVRFDGTEEAWGKVIKTEDWAFGKTVEMVYEAAQA